APAQVAAPIQAQAPAQAQTPAFVPESAAGVVTFQEPAAQAQAPAQDQPEAQGSEEEWSRALSGGSADAPDRKVELPEVDPNAEPAPQIEDTKPVQMNESANGRRFSDAQKAVRAMTDDLLQNLKSYRGYELYNKWRSYNAGVRRQTSALESGSELNGRCRLRWYERLYQDPLVSVGEVEYYTNAWGEFFMGSTQNVVAGVRLAREKMDVQSRGDRPAAKTPANSVDALSVLKASILEAATLHAKALAPMTRDDVAAVSKEAHSVFCAQVQSGHTIPSRGRAKYLVDALQKINKAAMYDAAETLLAALDDPMLQALSELDFAALDKIEVDGQRIARIATEAGDIFIGGPERNVWNLDRLATACCVIDLGGDDVYNEGTCNINRPVLVVLDLGNGADEYVAKNPGAQGGAILGVSIWRDCGGNDRYVAKDVVQGSAIGGVGILIDDSGDDRYLGFLRAQGTALCGLGLHIDRGGNDDYRAALFAQGFGAPGGFGALVDCSGNDHYFVGGYYFDSYPEHPGYDGWGQGVGAGIRRVACGGIGLILDGGGDDAYEFDYFGHGGGYWMGVGIARDFGGDDVRYAATSTMYDGSRRREQRWQRFGCGFGCHYAVGYLIDDAGNDAYNGTIMGLGMGWDLGAGFLVDFGGNDVFEATGGLTQGAGGE
ncbi:MAG: hypothetical protein HUK22_02365, partial [Thermoguttaceae bacterium]|nr:hypothetical protein [Thermoguttaceae bacterium]